MADLNRPGVEILPYPLQRHLVKNLTALAEKAANPDFLQLWSGQSASLSRETDVTTLLRTMVSDISSIAEPVQNWNRRFRADHPSAPTP
jgi:nitronate monooxygenase